MTKKSKKKGNKKKEPEEEEGEEEEEDEEEGEDEEEKSEETENSKSKESGKESGQDMNPCFNSSVCHPDMFAGLRKVTINIPAQVVCPYCGNYIGQVTTPVPGLLAWLLCTGFCVLACFLGCCLIQCCPDKQKEANQSCPVCKKELFHYQ